MPLYLTEADVAATFTMTDALRVLDAATRNIADGSATNAPPQRVSAGGAILQVLPAALDGRTGHTSYTVGSRGATFWVTLYAPRRRDAGPDPGQHPGSDSNRRRLGSGDAAPGPRGCPFTGTIGTGFQARTQIEAICLARPIEQVRVWGRDPERLHSSCAECSARLDRRVEAAGSARDAIAEGDVVATSPVSRRTRGSRTKSPASLLPCQAFRKDHLKNGRVR
jgi:alanine dehydrogenase